MRLMVTRDDCSRRSERILRAQRDVCHRNCEVVHGVTDHHVAKVDDACDLLQRLVDQHVVVVRVGVDDAATERGQPRRYMCGVVRGDRCDVRLQHGIIHQCHIGGDDVRCIREVPVELAMKRRMIERRQRTIQSTQRAPDVASQRVGLQRRGAERATVKCGDYADHMRAVLGDVATINRAHKRRRQPRAREMPHHRTLGLEHITRFVRVGDFQDEALARGGAEESVLIALARQVGGGGGDAVEAHDQRGGVSERQVGYAGHQVTEGGPNTKGRRSCWRSIANTNAKRGLLA